MEFLLFKEFCILFFVIVIILNFKLLISLMMVFIFQFWKIEFLNWKIEFPNWTIENHLIAQLRHTWNVRKIEFLNLKIDLQIQYLQWI